MSEEILRYDLIFHLCFEILGKDLNPEKVNPIINEFHNKLNDFYYKSTPFIIVTTAVDEFKIREINNTKVIGEYQLRIEIIDVGREGAMDRKNSEIRPLISRLVSKIKVERGLVSEIILKVVNSRFDDEFADGLWVDNPSGTAL